MVELMVAASLITIGLLGIFSLIISSTRMNKDVVHRFEATYLAAEGIEIMKNIIDTDVAIPGTAFFNSTLNSGNYEVQYNTDKENELTELGYVSSTRVLWLDRDVTGLYSYREAGVKTPYTRTIRVENEGDTITVRSVVEWNVGGEKNIANLEEVFQNWRETSS